MDDAFWALAVYERDRRLPRIGVGPVLHLFPLRHLWRSYTLPTAPPGLRRPAPVRRGRRFGRVVPARRKRCPRRSDRALRKGPIGARQRAGDTRRMASPFEALWQRVRVDPRHADIVPLFDEQDAKPWVPDWRIGYLVDEALSRRLAGQRASGRPHP